MQSLFQSLSHALVGTPLIAVLAAFLWGILSIVLSPCHLSSIPLIVGFISGQPEINPRRAFWTASSFSVGILLTIAVIGTATSVTGRMLGNLGHWTSYMVATVFFIVGLSLLGVFALPIPGLSNVGIQRKGLAAAFVLGALFGIALGPCTFAYMAPVLATALKVSAKAPLFGASLLCSYGIGHCAVIVGAGTSTTLVQRVLNWNAQTHAADNLRRGCGALVILGGLYLLYTAG
ncbi:MAG: cytochrome c biogenesis protein CcdA [Fimbriimonas sp.]|nr:cytochrome c biogenesis protein CcdA [Fimbriimonas sp.]